MIKKYNNILNFDGNEGVVVNFCYLGKR